MKRKILIVGSSMAMPRTEVKYEDTWVYNLKVNLDYDIVDKSRRASTSKRLVIEGGGDGIFSKGADLLEYYMPNIVITQIGITDCAPRLLGNGFASKLVNYSPNRIKNSIYSFLKRNIGRKAKNAYVAPEEFLKNWRNYLERAKKINTSVIIIKISEPTRLVLTKNPELHKSIKQYNQLYEMLALNYNNVVLIEPFTKEELEDVAIDEFHVNEIGHQIVYNKIRKVIELN